MADSQILAVAIAISVPLGLLFLSNSRLTDVKEALRAKIRLAESRLDKIDRLDQKLDAILKNLADHEVKLAK